jgi:23S rRNA (cytosine1962-C5)-methyltransferase
MQPLLDAIARLTKAAPAGSPQSPPDHPATTDAYRVFHGRGGLHAGCEHWTLDRYGPVWLLTSFQPVPDAELDTITHALRQALAAAEPQQPLNLMFQWRDEVRAHNRVLAGDVPDHHTVTEDGLRFEVHLPRGFNHGLFLDMAEGRRWVREWAQGLPGGRVLNLFAYTGAFSVAALKGGAGQVVNIDMARGALATAKRNHLLNELTSRASFLPHDIFSSWGRIKRDGPYDLVIADPPSYQKGSFVATKDYARLVRRLPELLAPGGEALLCLNTPKLGPDFIADCVAAEAPDLQFVERVANPPVFADVSADRALKVMVFKRPD